MRSSATVVRVTTPAVCRGNRDMRRYGNVRYAVPTTVSKSFGFGWGYRATTRASGRASVVNVITGACYYRGTPTW